MSKKNMTIDDLAQVISRGFSNVENKMATKIQLEGVERRLVGVESRLENIEKIILKQQGEQIKNLERRLNRLEEMFAVK